MAESISTGVGGKLTAATDAFVRPANTTAYTAGDVVSNDVTTTVLLKFSNVVRSPGGSGYVVKAKLFTDKKDETAQYRLELYAVGAAALTTGAPTVSIPVDNAADTTIYANRTYLVGYLDFPAVSAGADTANNTGALALWTGTPVAFHAYAGSGGGTSPNIPGDTSLYGKLKNMTGTTPASGQKFEVLIDVDNN